MGVGGREIGYLYGQYRRLKGVWENGVLTGKGLSYGGSRIRPEATGYGAIYYLQEVLKHENDTIEGKKIAISGYGNVGWGIMKKASQLGAKVTYFAGPDGYIHDPDGVITDEKLNFILEMRAKDPMHCKPYADKFGCEFVAGEKCWGVKDVDVYMPAAKQNDVKMESAEKIAASGVKYYIEVANMPTTNDALNFLRKQKGIIVAPSKAVNAGGVGVSACCRAARRSSSSRASTMPRPMTPTHTSAVAASCAGTSSPRPPVASASTATSAPLELQMGGRRWTARYTAGRCSRWS